MLFGLKDCANLIIRNTKTKKIAYVDYAKTSTIEFSADSVFASRKNIKAVRWDNNREGTFQTTMEIFSMDMVALLFGQQLEKGSLPWAKREVLKVSGGTAVLQGTPKNGTLEVFKLDDDKVTNLDEQTVGTTSTANKYSITGQTLTFNTTTTFPEDGWVACYYYVDVDSRSFTVDDVTFPDGYIISGDTFIRGTDQIDRAVQFDLTNVKPQSNVTLTMDVDNVATLEITWDIMGDSDGNCLTWKEIA